MRRPLRALDAATRQTIAEALLERHWKIRGLPLNHGIDIDVVVKRIRAEADTNMKEWESSFQAWRLRLVEELSRLSPG